MLKGTSVWNSRKTVVIFVAFLAALFISQSAYAQNRLEIKDGSSTTFFVTADGRFTGTMGYLDGSSSANSKPSIWMTAGVSGESAIYFGDTDDSNIGFIKYGHSSNSLFYYANNVEIVRFSNRRMSVGGETSPKSILSVKGSAGIGTTYAGGTQAPANGLIVEGRVGIGTPTPSSAYALQINGNAHAISGSWIDGSSREYKDNIRQLSLEEALNVFEKLEPVKYNYKSAKNEERVGFIAEDVPDLVALQDRKGLSALDMVAVLTKVVQDQQKSIMLLSEKIDELNKQNLDK